MLVFLRKTNFYSEEKRAGIARRKEGLENLTLTGHIEIKRAEGSVPLTWDGGTVRKGISREKPLIRTKLEVMESRDRLRPEEMLHKEEGILTGYCHCVACSTITRCHLIVDLYQIKLNLINTIGRLCVG